jgi:hypothetical protein
MLPGRPQVVDLAAGPRGEYLILTAREVRGIRTSEVFGLQARVLRYASQHPRAQFLSGTASPCSRRSARTRRARACTLAMASVAVTP